MADLDRTMNEELLQTLHGLIRHWEHEVVEFKLNVCVGRHGATGRSK